MKRIRSGTEWRNWSGTVKAVPRTVVYPASIEEVVQAVRQCRSEGRTLRVVGSGHSFTAVAASDDLLLSLDLMQGIAGIDRDAMTAAVWAGTKLNRLGELLLAEGLAQENLGDIDRQSIAGAISTGTHGSGASFGNMSTQVAAITVVTGTGEVVTCSADSDPALFKALQVSLGALGVIVQVTLRVQPAYRLRYESRKMALADAIEKLPEFAGEHRHFEFYWFPYAEPCQLKFMDITDRPAAPRKIRSYVSNVLLENTAFGLLSGLSRRLPAMSAAISRLCAATVPVAAKTDHSHRVFATPRLVKFNEMEYNLPAHSMADVIREMRETMDRRKFAVHFPVECRFSGGDDIWLSPAFGRDSAYIAVHMYRGMPHETYFAEMEDLFLRHGGRPHWGKLHSLDAERLAGLYPKWEAFHELRRRMDPHGIFVNRYLRRIFG